MKKRWLSAIPVMMLMTAPVSFQTAAASDHGPVQTAELPKEFKPILSVAPEHQPTTKQGSAGLEVRFIQTTISQAGFETSVDGLFGPKTDEQVRRFQSEHGLAVDGIVGVKTWTALFNEHKKELFSVEEAISLAEEKLNNDDLVFSSNGVIHKDAKGNAYYTLKAQSKNYIENGGSGTVGFYDVYKNGKVIESDPN